MSYKENTKNQQALQSVKTRLLETCAQHMT